MKLSKLIWILSAGAIGAGALICWQLSLRQPVTDASVNQAGGVQKQTQHRRPKVTQNVVKPVTPRPTTKINPDSLEPSVLVIADLKASFEDRYGAANKLAVAQLDSVNLDYLYDFFRQSSALDESNNGQLYKNLLMDKLCAANPPKLAELLTQIFTDKTQNVVVRDYALQHLIEYAQLPAGFDSQPTSKELDGVARTLGEAVKETDSTIAGTALFGMNRLSEAYPQLLDRDEVAAIANKLASDSTTGDFARTTAIQMCARMGVTNGLPEIYQTAQHGQTLPLQVSAIAALGFLGGNDAKPLLNDILQGEAEPLKPAAQQALRQLALLEKQRAQELQDAADRVRAEELRRHKEAQRSSTPL